jgi:hypothetical protein
MDNDDGMMLNNIIVGTKKTVTTAKKSDLKREKYANKQNNKRKGTSVKNTTKPTANTNTEVFNPAVKNDQNKKK